MSLKKENLRKIIKEVVKEVISESSINRTISWMDSHDVITMSAFRERIKDETKLTKAEDVIRMKEDTEKRKENNGIIQSDILTKQENLSRNKDLKAALLAKGYGVTIIHGNYIEGLGSNLPYEVGEQTLMVVNTFDKNDFVKVCAELGEYYNQDSILVIPKGTRTAYLYGTNNAEFPGYHNTIDQGRLSVGLGSKFMSRVGNSPFAFVKDGVDGDGKPLLLHKQSSKDMTDDEANDYEHSYVWTDDKPSFQSRKSERMKKVQLEEYVNNLHGGQPVLETINGTYKGFARQNVGTYGANVLQCLYEQKRNLTE